MDDPMMRVAKGDMTRTNETSDKWKDWDDADGTRRADDSEIKRCFGQLKPWFHVKIKLF